MDTLSDEQIGALIRSSSSVRCYEIGFILKPIGGGGGWDCKHAMEYVNDKARNGWRLHSIEPTDNFSLLIVMERDKPVAQDDA